MMLVSTASNTYCFCSSNACFSYYTFVQSSIQNGPNSYIIQSLVRSSCCVLDFFGILQGTLDKLPMCNNHGFSSEGFVKKTETHFVWATCIVRSTVQSVNTRSQGET